MSSVGFSEAEVRAFAARIAQTRAVAPTEPAPIIVPAPVVNVVMPDRKPRRAVAKRAQDGSLIVEYDEDVSGLGAN